MRKMRKNWNRILSGILILAMVSSPFSGIRGLPVQAAENHQEESDKAIATSSDATAEKCICTSACTEEDFNENCPVCKEGYTECELVKDGELVDDRIDWEAIAEVKALFEAIRTNYFTDYTEETIEDIVNTMDEDTLNVCKEQTTAAMEAFGALTQEESSAFIEKNEALYKEIYIELAKALESTVLGDKPVYSGEYLNVVELFAKLPGADSITAEMTAEEKEAINAQVSEAMDAFEALSDEDYALFQKEHAEALLAVDELQKALTGDSPETIPGVISTEGSCEEGGTLSVKVVDNTLLYDILTMPDGSTNGTVRYGGTIYTKLGCIADTVSCSEETTKHTYTVTEIGELNPSGVTHLAIDLPDTIKRVDANAFAAFTSVSPAPAINVPKKAPAIINGTKVTIPTGSKIILPSCETAPDALKEYTAPDSGWPTGESDYVFHTFGPPVWSWDKSGETPTATATFTCKDCGGVYSVTTENGVTITSEEVDAACTAPKKTVYTAEVTVTNRQEETIQIDSTSKRESTFITASTPYTDHFDVVTGTEYGSHQLGLVAKQKATKSQVGWNTEHYRCSTCGKHFTDAEGTTPFTNFTVAEDYSFTTDKVSYRVTGEDDADPYEVTITDGTLVTGDYTVPKSVCDSNGIEFQITSIGDSGEDSVPGAFQGNENLTSLVIPATVTKVYSKAFYNCTKLKHIEIQGAISQFNDTDTVSEMTFGIDDKKTSDLRTIKLSDAAWAYSAFGNSLNDLQTVLSGGRSKSWFMNNNIESIDMGKAEVIPYSAFVGAEGPGIDKLTIPASVKYISALAFQGTKLGTVTVGENSQLQIIFTEAFKDSRLESINLPDSLELISQRAFKETRLTKIVIPTGGRDGCGIYSQAFAGCYYLANVYAYPVKPPTLGLLTSGNIFDDCKPDLNLHIPCNAKENYEKANGWSEYQGNYVLFHDFSGDSCVEDATNPASGHHRKCVHKETCDGVDTELRPHIFGKWTKNGIVLTRTCTGCDYQENQNLNDGYSFTTDKVSYRVTSADDSGRYEVTITDGTLVTGDYTVPESVCDSNGIEFQITSIGDSNHGAFQGNENLTSLVIPATVTKVYSKTFYNCTNLKRIEIQGAISQFHDTVSEMTFGIDADKTSVSRTIKLSDATWAYSALGDGSISNPDDLPTVLSGGRSKSWFMNNNIGSIDMGNAEVIPYSAFVGAYGPGIDKLTIPASVKYISASAFQGTKLGTVTVGENSQLQIIFTKAFMDSTLESINLPDSLETISQQAFADCSALANVYAYPVKPPTLVMLTSGNIFDNCASDLKLHILCNAKADYERADGWSAYSGKYVLVHDFSGGSCVADATNPASGHHRKCEHYETCGGVDTALWPHIFGEWTTNGMVSTRTCTGCGYQENQNLDGLKEEIVRQDFTEVSDSLKEKGYATVEAVEEKLKEETQKTSADYNKIEYCEVKLKISTDKGQTWKDAQAEDFPAEGITVILPYPAGTDKSFDFIVTHMLTIAMNGHEVGYVEHPAVTKTDSGIQVTLTGLSPVSVAWKETAPVINDYAVTAAASPAEAGAVTGQGNYPDNSSVTVIAAANRGYKFVRWMENGVEVSTNASYTFTITGNRNFVAEFELSGSGSTGDDSSSSENRIPGKYSDGSYNSTFTPSIGGTGGVFHGSGNDWTYTKPDGTLAKSEWISSGGDWYYFGEDGKMKFDWFLDPKRNHWYMLSRNHDGRFGAALRGWYYENQDGKWYFLNPFSSEMLTGWQYIDHKWYYFTSSNEGQTYVADNVNDWYFDPEKNIRPLGSMYRKEETPDGHEVDGDGVRIQ